MTRVGGHVHEIRRNVLVSRLLLVANLAFLAATGALFARLVDAGWVGTLKTAGVFLAGGVLAITISLARLPRVTGALPDPGYLPEVRGLLDGISLAAGILPPQLYLIQDPYPNAFAFGLHPNRSRVAVTTGLLELMSPRELEAIVAHEVAHIANRDTQVMTVAYGTFAFLNFISMFWAFVAAAAATGAISAEDDDSGVAVVAGVIGLAAFSMLLLTLPVTAGSWLLTMAVSRDREALADATAVRYLGSPTQLRHAFEKMAGYPVRPYTRQIAAMCVHGASKHRSAGSTHPPMSWRINTLRNLEGLPPDEVAAAYVDAVPRPTPFGVVLPLVGLVLLVWLVVAGISGGSPTFAGSGNAEPAIRLACDRTTLLTVTASADPVLDATTFVAGRCFTGGDGEIYAVARYTPQATSRLTFLTLDTFGLGPHNRSPGTWVVISTDTTWDDIAARAQLNATQIAEYSWSLTVPTTSPGGSLVPFPDVTQPPSPALTPATTPPVTQDPETVELTALVPEIETMLVDLAQDRAAIATAVAGVQSCRLDATSAADEVQYVHIANRMNVLRSIRALYVVTPTVITIRDLFGQAIADAIGVDRAYLAWMRDVAVDPATCTTSSAAPSTANLDDAARLAVVAAASKTVFVNAFNPVAARFPGHRSDWTAANF